MLYLSLGWTCLGFGPEEPAIPAEEKETVPSEEEDPIPAPTPKKTRKVKNNA
jgi:hypothetical protein